VRPKPKAPRQRICDMNPHPIIQETIDHHFPGLKPAPSLEDEIISLRAENLALAERLREIVGELRNIDALLDNGCASAGVANLRDLLRRLEENQ
jgi:hypothetical protein